MVMSRFALKLGCKYDIAAHGIVGAVRTDSIKEAIAGYPSFFRICIPPAFKYRYHTKDIPYGLAAWAKLAKQFGVDTPIMDAMITLGRSSLEELGIAGMDCESLKEYLTNG